MILLIAVALGLTCGFLRARLSHRAYQSVEVRHPWLVLAAYLPQFFAFYLPATRVAFPSDWVPAVLVGSQFLLLIFAWLNRRLPGLWLLGSGLFANLLVISLNGGLMPLIPENAARLLPAGSPVILELGKQVGFGKDILLEKAATRLWFLGDVFMLPEVLRYPLAFSIGDILISMGAFWLLWKLGGPHHLTEEVSP